ncbi:MAG TPA: hypothetical protein VKX49_04325 [Bryobacteraceae bacterium]|nr:hypothetical protein [Bryobacteraceae bacterium]
MAKTIAISQVGGVIAGSGAPAAPGNVTAISVTGFVDPSTNAGQLTVSVTAPTDPGDTIVGVHLYLEAPDVSATQPFVIGTSTIGDGSTMNGPFSPLDVGKWPLSQAQPWTVPFTLPPGLDASIAIASRLYANPYSVSYEPKLVQANQAGATPNQTFTLVPTNSGASADGTNVTTLTGGDGGPIGIVATALSPVNVSGKLETPVLVDITDTPANTRGWAARLVLTVGNANPTDPANQQIVSDIITQAGPVYAPKGDGITTPHSFVLATPTAITNATVWLQAGLPDPGSGRVHKSSGGYRWNNIVPGITPSFPITYGSTVGTVDASAVLAATIAASMAVVNGLFGVATAGITNPLLGSGAVATINVQNLAITNPLLASLCVQAANLAASSVTATAIAAAAVGTAAIQTAAITNALIANLAVSGAQIQSATITGANIASATITNALISDLSVSKLTAGSASFSGTATFANGSNSVQISSSAVTLSNGTQEVQVTASGLNLYSGAGSVGVSINSSGQATFTNGTTSTVINGNNISAGELDVATLKLLVNSPSLPAGNVSSTATAGAATLPSNPQGFFWITLGSTTYRVPYYNA